MLDSFLQVPFNLFERYAYDREAPMDLKQSITHNLTNLWFLMGQRHAHGTHQRRDAYDASRGRGRIIALLQLKDGISTKEISQILAIRVSSTNEVLSKMEDAGLVERRPSETDRRVMLVYLTDKGREVELAEPKEFDPFEGFGEDELKNLEDYTERMVKNAEKEFDPGFIGQMRNRQAHFDAFFDQLDKDGPRPDMHGFGGRGAGMGPHADPRNRPHGQHGGHGHGDWHHRHTNHGRGFDDGPFGTEDMDLRFFDDRRFNPRF